MERTIELEADRLCLRHWRQADSAPFGEMNADPKVMEFLPAVLSYGESDTVVQHCNALIAERGWGLWQAKSSRRVSSSVSLACIPRQTSCPSLHVARWDGDLRVGSGETVIRRKVVALRCTLRFIVLFMLAQLSDSIRRFQGELHCHSIVHGSVNGAA